MLFVPCCCVQWLVVVSTVFLTSRFPQAQSVSFPGSFSHYPSDHYVMEGRDFNTTCVVTLNSDNIKATILFMLDSTTLSNSNDTTIISTRHGDRVIGTLIIHNPVLSNMQRLSCIARSVVSRQLINISQTSVIHSYEVPFVITKFPPGQLPLDTTTSYTMECVVMVDKNFPLEAVDVSVLYYSISPDANTNPTYRYREKTTNKETRTISISVLIRDVARKIGGTYICNAGTKTIENAVIHQYNLSKNTKIFPSTSQSSQNSSGGTSNGDNSTDKNKNWMILLFVFSIITVILLIVFTLLIIAVIWTKKHRSRNYPVSPFPGTIPITTTNAKSNYYLDSPVSAVNNVALQQPAMALHITPRLQSISSAETDV